MSEDKWAQIIDKLTDPLEMAVTKIFSARFLVAIIFALGTIILAFYLVEKFPESAPVVWTGVTNITIVIVKDYFARTDRNVIQNGNQK